MPQTQTLPLLLGLLPLLAASLTARHGLALAVALMLTWSATQLLLVLTLRITGMPANFGAIALITATAVALTDLLFSAWLHPLHTSIALSIPLIVANAAWLQTLRSDQPGIGIGLIVQLAGGVLACGVVREVLGQHRPFSLAGVDTSTAGLHLLQQPAGLLLLLGLLLALKNMLDARRYATDTNRRSPR